MENITTALNKWKKVRRPQWKEESYIYLSEENKELMFSDGTPATLHYNQLIATDWEEYKESFPIKIGMSAGFAELFDEGGVVFKNICGDLSGIVPYELDEAEEIIKKAKEIRDQNGN